MPSRNNKGVSRPRTIVVQTTTDFCGQRRYIVTGDDRLLPFGPYLQSELERDEERNVELHCVLMNDNSSVGLDCTEHTRGSMDTMAMEEALVKSSAGECQTPRLEFHNKFTKGTVTSPSRDTPL
jgi:hypothetical protein